MISVPTSTGSQPSPSTVTPMVGEMFLMMAAAQMHSEGRLVQSKYGEPDTTQAPHDLPPKSKPPLDYAPSNGQQDGPAMMT